MPPDPTPESLAIVAKIDPEPNNGRAIARRIDAHVAKQTAIYKALADHAAEFHNRAEKELEALRTAADAYVAERTAAATDAFLESSYDPGPETSELLRKIMTVFVHPEYYAAEKCEYELVYDRGEWVAKCLIEEHVAKRTAALRTAADALKEALVEARDRMSVMMLAELWDDKEAVDDELGFIDTALASYSTLSP